MTVYILASLALIATPGQDMLYVITRSLAQGRFAGVCSAIGVCIGILVHTALAALGVGAILHASETLFLALKFVGAAYLVYLGIRLLLTRDGANLSAQARAPLSPAALLRQGILSNVTNPKIVLFFFAFLPQFVSVDEAAAWPRMLELSSVFMLVTLVVFVIYGLLAAGVRNRILSRPRVMAWVRRIFAGSFVALAGRLAFTNR
jgi:threonine/homoserine/homoserine lactone efflux protein